MARLKTVKRSISVVIEAPEREGRAVLAVKRPEDDADLPGIWGLPAATLTPGESWEDAVRRAGSEKLGVELEPVAELREGTRERPEYLLHMKLYRARIVEGRPRVAQSRRDVTQYTDWKWKRPQELEEGALRGSVCCQLYLEEPNGHESA